MMNLFLFLDIMCKRNILLVGNSFSELKKAAVGLTELSKSVKYSQSLTDTHLEMNSVSNVVLFLNSIQSIKIMDSISESNLTALNKEFLVLKKILTK